MSKYQNESSLLLSQNQYSSASNFPIFVSEYKKSFADVNKYSFNSIDPYGMTIEKPKNIIELIRQRSEKRHYQKKLSNPM